MGEFTERNVVERAVKTERDKTKRIKGVVVVVVVIVWVNADWHRSGTDEKEWASSVGLYPRIIFFLLIYPFTARVVAAP